MDEPGLERSLPELQKQLEPLVTLKSAKDIVAEVAREHALGAAPLFRFSSTQDLHDATQSLGPV